MAKFRHCSMRQSKVRAENTQYTRDIVVNHLGCDIWDTRKFVFYTKKYSQFHRLNLHISLFIDCLLLLSSEWSWNSYCSSICSCPQHVVKWPRGQVGSKQLFMLSRGARFDSVMIQSNNYCGEWLGIKSRSDRFVFYTEINWIS